MNVQEYRDLVGKVKKPRNQIEGKHQQTLGNLLNGRLRCKLSANLIFWTYSPAGEKKSLKTAVLQKRKGLQKGDLDYRFEIRHGSLLYIVYLETKTTSGNLTTEQKEFIKKKQGLSNAICYTSRNLEESIKILENEKILMI